MSDDDEDVEFFKPGSGRRVKARKSEVERELDGRAAQVGRRNGRVNAVTIRHVAPWSLRAGGRPARGKRA